LCFHALATFSDTVAAACHAQLRRSGAIDTIIQTLLRSEATAVGAARELAAIAVLALVRQGWALSVSLSPLCWSDGGFLPSVLCPIEANRALLLSAGILDVVTITIAACGAEAESVFVAFLSAGV
jgi:hypothetical protein